MPTMNDTVSMYYTVILGLMMAVMATGALIYSIVTSSFRWVQMMFFLCILQDLGTAAFEFVQYLEADKIYHKAHI